MVGRTVLGAMGLTLSDAFRLLVKQGWWLEHDPWRHLCIDF